MKKLLVLISLLLAGNALYAQKITDATERKAFRDEFVNECMKSAMGDVSDTALYKAMYIYCNCSSDKVLDKLSKKQIESMATLTEKEVDEMITPVIQTCLDKLQIDLKEITK